MYLFHIYNNYTLEYGMKYNAIDIHAQPIY